MRVIDVMSTEVLTVTPDETLKVAARKMVEAGVSGLPVLDNAGKLVGIITEADFVLRKADQEGARQRRLLDALLHREQEVVDAETVADVMTRNPAVIYPEASLTEAARVMVGHGVKRLPVVDDDNTLQGIVSRADIVSAFTVPDDVIQDEIREDVIERVLFLDKDSLIVEVEEGVVILGGGVPTRTDARLLEELVRRLDGVVRVESSLSWDVDDAELP